MGVYDGLVATALRIIERKGQSVTWEKRTATGGTAAKPGSTTVTNNTVNMCFVPLEREYLSTFLAMFKNTEVPTGLILGLMGRVSFAPELKDTVLRGSERLSVADENGIEVYDPNGEGAILYLVRLSR